MNWRMTLVVVAILGMAAGPSSAREPEDTFKDLARCATIPEPPARLSCYDALMPRVRAALATAPEQLSADDQTTLFGLDFSGLFGRGGSATTPEQFGSDTIRRPEPEGGGNGLRPLESISAAVTDYSRTPLGKFIVFLDNGQVWRQQDSDNEMADFRRNPGDNKVTISKGAIGSYNMTLNGSSRVFRVKRVK